ncbi:unnamed protein product [Diabrotica balteata]|uniref:Uncharacterized protein n=1 Tax=Diabrotica balteata TaxID=107213 RepID=A0A9N9TEC5_DIABA|nr:unnamed protein product [Diabrotica balteata]
MSRNRRILELALKNSEIDAEPDMEQNLFSGEMENLDIVEKDFDVTENPLCANTSYVSPDEILIQYGNHLFEFKRMLRPGCSKFLDPNGSDVESSGHSEPFSADVSEYVPSSSEEIQATERQYREVFYNEFNIDFLNLKKDLCATCDIYKRASIEQRESLQPNYTHHVASKIVVREFKTQIKSLAQCSNLVVAACFNLQKILSTPMSSASYYKQKLAVYNFTVFDLEDNKGHCYVWDETVGRKC